MATLNVKNFPEPPYRELRARARRRHRSIAQEVTQIIEQAVERERSLSLLDLKGLGRDARAGLDDAAHVDTERRSWD